MEDGLEKARIGTLGSVNREITKRRIRQQSQIALGASPDKKGLTAIDRHSSLPQLSDPYARGSPRRASTQLGQPLGSRSEQKMKLARGQNQAPKLKTEAKVMEAVRIFDQKKTLPQLSAMAKA